MIQCETGKVSFLFVCLFCVFSFSGLTELLKITKQN